MVKIIRLFCVVHVHNLIINLNSSSWGYRKVFEQYAVILQQKYPSLAIEGENHPPPYLNQKIASILVCLVSKVNKLFYTMLYMLVSGNFENTAHPCCSVWNQYFWAFRCANSFSLGVDSAEQILCMLDDFLSMQCYWGPIDFNWSIWNHIKWWNFIECVSLKTYLLIFYFCFRCSTLV